MVEVDKSHKGLDFGHMSCGWPVMNTSHLDGVYFYVTFQEDKAEILYCGSSENAFLSLEVEPMLSEDVEDLCYNGVLLLLSLAAKYEDVVHVNNHDSFIYEFLEDVDNNFLECFWAVSEAKEHD